MTNEELFDVETKPFGGRLSRHRLPAFAQRSYNQILVRANDLIESARQIIPRLPAIHLDFAHSPTVNAFAFKADGRYFIGITTGTFYMLYLVANRMLSDRNTFPWVGNPQEEAESLPPIIPYDIDADKMHARFGAPETPTNSVRSTFASFLQEQAMLFLIGHEIAHITLGHVDYLSSTSQGAFTVPIGSFSGRGKQDILERQCLGIHADMRSIHSRIDSMRLTFQHPSYSSPPSASVNTPSALIRDWAVSTNILFRIFGDFRFSNFELNNSLYPPLPMRRLICEGAAFENIKSLWSIELADAAAKALAEARNWTELAFATILKEKVSIEGLKAASGSTGKEYMQRVENHMNSKLGKALNQFSYEPVF